MGGAALILEQFVKEVMVCMKGGMMMMMDDGTLNWRGGW